GDEHRRGVRVDVGDGRGGVFGGGGLCRRGAGEGGDAASADVVVAVEIEDAGDGVGLVGVKAVAVDLGVVGGGADQHGEVSAGGAAHGGDARGGDVEAGGGSGGPAQGRVRVGAGL